MTLAIIYQMIAFTWWQKKIKVKKKITGDKKKDLFGAIYKLYLYLRIMKN